MPNAFLSVLSRLFKRAGSYGTMTGRKLPGGLAPPGLGDVVGSPYVDTARKQRQPTRPELLTQFRNAVFTCANLNANGVADVPLKLYVQTSTGDPRPKCRVKGLSKKQEIWIRSSSSTSGRVAGDADVEEVTDHPFLDLLSKPNPWMSCASLIKLESLYCDLVGNCYWWIGDRGRFGIPNTLWPLPAHLVFPYRSAPSKQDNTEELISYYLFTSYRTQYQIPPEDIVHFRRFNPFDPYTSGWAPLQAVIELVNVTEKMLGHTQAALDNQARPDAIVTPADVIGYAEAERLERRLQTKFRNAGYGGIMVAESPVDIKELQWSPADLQALEVYGVTKDQVCDAYDVPQAMYTKDTNLANLQAALDQHARFAIKPRLVERDETLNRCMIPLYDDSGRLFVASDNPVPEDEDAKVKRNVAYLSAGVLKRSEVRTSEGCEDEDWADKPTLPTNQKLLDDKGEMKPDPNAGMGGPNGKPGNGQSNGGGVRGGAAAGGPQGGKGGGKGGKKTGKKKKKKGGKKGLGEALLRFNSEVIAGRLRRHQAVFSLAHGYGITGEEADYLITRERPGDPRPTLKAIAAQARTKAKDNLEWTKPDLDGGKDWKEVKRACKELADLGADIDTETLADCLAKGSLEKLDDKTWNNIVNTDSLDVDSIEDIRQRAHKRGKKVRDIFQEYMAGKVTAPIVVCFKENPDKYYLVNGETRLSIACLFDVRPQMWYADLPDEVKAKSKALDCLPCGKGKLSDCVSRKIPIFKQEHPDWDQAHCVAAAYGYCREKAKKRKEMEVKAAAEPFPPPHESGESPAPASDWQTDRDYFATGFPPTAATDARIPGQPEGLDGDGSDPDPAGSGIQEPAWGNVPEDRSSTPTAELPAAGGLDSDASDAAPAGDSGLHGGSG